MTAVVGEEYCVVANEAEGRELTVRKTSIFSSGDGFEAYDHLTGDTLFRVETYDHGHALAGTAEKLLLMDAVGATILTVRRKWPSLHQRWEGFTGEHQENQKPLFTVRRSSIFGDRDTVDVDIHGTNPTEYKVEGSFRKRNCRVLYNGKHETLVAAEINRKVDTCAHVVMLGRDVFCLSVKPGFDAAFVMGVVLVLDHICGDDEGVDVKEVDTSAHVVMFGRDVFCLSVKTGFDAAFLMGVVLVLDQICGHDDSDDGVGGDGVEKVAVGVAGDQGFKFECLC